MVCEFSAESKFAMKRCPGGRGSKRSEGVALTLRVAALAVPWVCGWFVVMWVCSAEAFTQRDEGYDQQHATDSHSEFDVGHGRSDDTFRAAVNATALRWRRSDQFASGGEGGFSAIAAHEATGNLAIAGEEGVSIGSAENRKRGDGVPRSVSLRGVRDLAFAANGELYVATSNGLWIVPAHRRGATTEHYEASPAIGEQARRVNRVAIGAGFVAVATDDGAFVSPRRAASLQAATGFERPKWVRVDSSFPIGPVDVVATHRDEWGAYLWANSGSSLWKARVTAAGAVVDVVEVEVPGRPHGDQAPVDLVTDLPGGRLGLVYANTIFVGDRRGASEEHPWQIVRPVLPPGSTLKRIGHWEGGYWLATDRGLLLAGSLEGPWRRAGPPAGRARVSDVEVAFGRYFVAGAGGLFIGTSAPRTQGEGAARSAFAAAGHAGPKALPGPDVREVHRAALKEQGLEARVFKRAWRGVGRRAWLPVIGLRFDADRDRGRGSDIDEVLISGENHLLHDSDRDRSFGIGASLTMTWDFRDAAYEPEQIDISREARLVIGLRDDVLDEVNQIYFERLVVAGKLDALNARGPRIEAPPRRSEDLDESRAQSIVTLSLRLLELEAGLDAWTGGWFSAQLPGYGVEAM
ncbi:MAG: hypothetical protein ACI8W3_001638 [Myxococcota bacterium]|jgi:hypothetical protein